MTTPDLIISREDLLSKAEEIREMYFSADTDTTKGRATKEIFDIMVGESNSNEPMTIKGVELIILKPDGANCAIEAQTILEELKIEHKVNY